MRIIYIANARIPTEKAHGIQIMNTCVALARTGNEVELVLPWRRNEIKADPFNFYKVERNLKIRRLFAIDLFGFLPERLAFILGAGTFSASVFLYALCNRDSVYYGRDESILAPLSLLSKRIFWETHSGSLNASARRLIKKARGIICITKGLSDLYVSNGASPEKVFVSPDGVDIKKFETGKSKEGLRESLGLPEKSFIAAYCGSLGLYSWKGVDVFLDSIKSIATPSISYLVVGGNRSEIEDLKGKYPDSRIRFVGKVPPEDVPKYLLASDALILPNKSGNEVSEKFTSPMKLFEYMAARKPIIASDLPSIREVLDQSNAALFKSDDPRALAQAVERASSDPSYADKIASQAFSDVKRYTWDDRAKNLISFISSSHER